MADHDIKQSLTGEIASRERLYFSFAGLGMALPNPDPVLKKLGRDIEVYRDLKSDAVVGGNARRRRAAILSLEYGLDQGDASDRVMQLCESVLQRIRLRKLIRGLHDAAWYGYQPAEVNWESTGGLWLPSDVVCKPPEWFSFDMQNRLCFRATGNPMGESVPIAKFIVATNDASYDNPYGVPELSRVYWPTVFKKGGLKFWLRFADKYGQAFLIAKHPRSTTDAEIKVILDALEKLEQDGVGAFPDDGSVDIKESAGKSGSADLFERLLMYCRSEINIAMLGSNQATEASSTKASASEGNEVADDLRDGDAEMISSAIDDLLQQVVRINIGEHEAMPTWSMWEQDRVDDVQASRDQKLAQAGAKFSAQYFEREYKLQPGDVTVTTGMDVKSPLAFSELVPIKDYANQHTALLAQSAAPVVQDWLNRIQRVLAQSRDMKDAQERLLHVFSDLPLDKLGEVMTLARTAAVLAGMAEVAEETALESVRG